MYIFMTEEEANKRILQYGNVLVTNRELHILNGPRFLNDIIIEFYFLHISNALLQSHQTFRDDILLVSPALSFFLQQDFGDDSHIKEFVESNNVASKQVVMFTVNNNRDGGRTDGGSHWSLLVYYRKSNTFVHYDSLGCNASFARELFRAVKKHVATPAESSSTTGTIVDGDVDSTNTSTINIGDVDSNNTTAINIGDVDSNNTTAINIGDVNSNNTSTMNIGDVDSTNTSTINGINGDGNSTDSTMVCTDSTNTMVIDGDSTMIGVDFTDCSSMVGGDSTYTSMIHDLTTSSSKVGGDYTNCSRVQGDCTSFDRDDYHMEQYNPKKPRMGRRCDGKEVDMRRKHGYYSLHPYSQRRSSLWDLRHFPIGYQYISYNYNNGEDDDDGFKEERCMPKQKNLYDCGLYVMEIARVICEWYYLDDEAKQQQPEHQVLYCKLGGGGRFPNISEYVHTSLESTMRHMILAIIQQRARESGLLVDLFSDDDDETLQPQQANSDDNEILVDSDFYDILSRDNESKDDETPQFGSQPKFDDDETLVDSVVLDLFYKANNDKTPKFGPQPRPQQFKFDDETLEDCGGVDNLRLGALLTPQPAVSSTTKDEPQEISDSILEEKCSLISKFSKYLQGDDLLAKKLA